MDKVTHFHIPADNMRRAKMFYRNMFGWEFKITEMDQDYTLTTTVKTDQKQIPAEPGAINGALFLRRRPDEGPSIVVTVQDIYGSLENVEKAGGHILRPVEPAGNLGLFAEIRDSEGNILGLWQEIEK
ncbi:VOC family protein [Methanolobus halotolerans]|uniref:Glyoxalase n=1 Tax=Methanolobus halotolerans TaxID=2052935 RepID=A0A4E0QSG7_9EURY|nr:VOC family protein [Methanolobus halotolerans]TGC10528.1 glyoxalase [Methanolobus halotolerans]